VIAHPGYHDYRLRRKVGVDEELETSEARVVRTEKGRSSNAALLVNLRFIKQGVTRCAMADVGSESEHSTTGRQGSGQKLAECSAQAAGFADRLDGWFGLRDIGAGKKKPPQMVDPAYVPGTGVVIGRMEQKRCSGGQ